MFSEKQVQDVMWLVFEYARIMHEIEPLLGDERSAGVKRAHDKDTEIRAAIRALGTAEQQPVAPDDIKATLAEANSLCRSAHAVAERVSTQYATVYAGTNFGALHERLHESLQRQAEVMKRYGICPTL